MPKRRPKIVGKVRTLEKIREVPVPVEVEVEKLVPVPVEPAEERVAELVKKMIERVDAGVNRDPPIQFKKGDIRIKQPDGKWSAWMRFAGGGASVPPAVEPTPVSVSDEDVVVVPEVSDINFEGNNVVASDDGDDTVTVTIEGPAIQEDGSTVVADPVAVDFEPVDFDVTDAGGDVANVALAKTANRGIIRAAWLIDTLSNDADAGKLAVLNGPATATELFNSAPDMLSFTPSPGGTTPGYWTISGDCGYDVVISGSVKGTAALLGVANSMTSSLQLYEGRTFDSTVIAADSSLDSVNSGNDQPVSHCVTGASNISTGFKDFTWSVHVEVSASASLEGLVPSATQLIITAYPKPEGPFFTIDDIQVDEDAGPAVFTITKNNDDGKAASVAVSTRAGTAVAPTDYTAIDAQVVNFGVGETTKTVNVTIIDDGDTTGNLNFFLDMSLPVGAGLKEGQTTGTCTIIDDE